MEGRALNAQHLSDRLLGQNQDFWLHLQADTQLNKYPAKQHARAVAAKLGVEEGLLFLAGEKTTLLKDSDQNVPFRQRRYFYYLTGCDESDCYVLYDIGQDVLTLYIPKIDLRHAVWGGAGSTKLEAYAKYDVDVVDYTENISTAIARTFIEQKCPGKIYLLDRSSVTELRDSINLGEFTQSGKTITDKGPEPRRRTLGMKSANERLQDFLSGLLAEIRTLNRFHDGIEQNCISQGKIDTTQLKSAIELCRVIKFPHEIELIRRANEISASAHRAVLERIRHFKSEREIEGLFLDTCISAGAHNQAYNIIAGAGTNAAVLHYIANDAPLDDKQVVLLDAGAEYNCYASDVTRTFPISGYWSDEAKNIYDVVSDMQLQCIARIRPGVHFRDLQILAMVIATRSLLKLGVLCNGTLREILEAGTIRAFFPHGLGHHVGLEVHDVLHVPIQSEGGVQACDVDMGFYKECGVDELPRETITELYKTLIDPSTFMSPVTLDGPVLEPGMVVTVEPGIYFSEFALSKVYLVDPKHAKFINKKILLKYMPVGGVRIEDDILVTKDGYENLTTAPQGDEALRIIRGEPDPMDTSNSTHGAARTSPSVALRAATPIDKGKAPLRELPTEPMASSIIDHALESTMLRSSRDAKFEVLDDLPPSNESQSLIGAFPFANGNAGCNGEPSNSRKVSNPSQLKPTNMFEQAVEAHQQIAKQIQNLQTLQDPFSPTSTISRAALASTGRELAAVFDTLTVSIQNLRDMILPENKTTQMTGPEASSLSHSVAQSHSMLENARITQDHEPSPSQDASSSTMESEPSDPRTENEPQSTYVRALYDFDGQNDRGCVIFHKNDVLNIRLRSDRNWWYARHMSTGKIGWLPASYVKEMTSNEAAQYEGASSAASTAASADINASKVPASTSHDRESVAQIRSIVSKQKLQSVVTKELAVLLEATDPAATADTIEADISAFLGDAEAGLICFSGLCMQLKAKHPGIDFAALPGAGMEKFGKLYGKVDECMKDEFGPGHLFHKLGSAEKTALLDGRWKVAGIKEETAEQIGVCGSCRVCRVGFAQWDERWLASSEEEEEDDEV